MKKHYLLFVVILLFTCVGLFAQDQVITGKVTDESGVGLPGAAVQIKGTTTGTITDVDGNYSISVAGAEAPVLSFSYVGYLTREIAVGDQTVIDVQLELEAESLDEIVVIGYGVTKKSLVTGAIAKVDADEIAQSRPTRVESALQGKTAGVLVQQTSGAPGAEQNIIIRGVGTQNAVRPIYVIDGIRTDGIDWLDPEDIQSIEVLKDAASAAIYGTEAANGVVLITTKLGSEGKARVSYDGFYGMQSLNTKYSVMNRDEYLDYYRTGLALDGVDQDDIDDEFPLGTTTDTDWLKEIFEPAPIQKHKLSISGGSEKTSYYFSLSYTNQDGIIGGGDKSNFRRYSSRLNLETEATNWLKVGSRITYTYTEKKGVSQNDVFGSVSNNAMVLDPLTPARVADTTGISDLDRTRMLRAWGNDWHTRPGIQDDEGYFGFSDYVKNEIKNPVAQLHNDKDGDQINKVVAGAFGEITFLEGLTFKSTFDIDHSHQYNRGFTPLQYYNSVEGPRNHNEVRQEINMHFTWQWENYISFNKSFGEHTVGAVAGVSASEWKHEVLGGIRYDMIEENENFAWLDYTTYIDTTGNATLRPWGRVDGWTRLGSYFGRVSYNYAEKYLFTFNIRRDGSSKFGPDFKYGNFPSVSVGWIASRENFWPFQFINYAKPRFSWGKNGNSASLGWNHEYLPTTIQSYYYLSGNETLWAALEAESLTNPEYRWEASRQVNIGLDLGFLQNRFFFTFDWYDKETQGLLLDGFAPDAAGNNPPVVNGGTVSNKGIELELSHNNMIGDFRYDVKLTASHNKNEVIELNESVEYIGGGYIGTMGNAKRFEPGHPAWYFYGFETDGIFTSQEQIDNHVNEAGNPLQANAQLGDVIYRDIAGPADSLGNPTGPDGIINANDMTEIGSPWPNWITGLNVNLGYKGFDLNLYMYASIGNNTLNAIHARNDISNPNKALYYYEDAWTPDNPGGDFPRPTVRDRNQNFSRINSFIVQDGSYLRISNLTLGYTLPENLTDRVGIGKLRVYVAADNLATFTKYRGIDPEIGGDYWGTNGQQWAGIDRGVYPKARVFMAGVNVNF